MTGYGSESYFRNGAAFWTRLSMLRMYITFDEGVICPESRKLKSSKRRAKAARRQDAPGVDAALARILGRDLAARQALVVELGGLGAGDDVPTGLAAEAVVDLRTGVGQGRRAGRRQVGEGEVRAAVRVDAGLADRGQHGAVAVGVIEMLVDEPRRHGPVELPHRGDGRRLAASPRPSRGVLVDIT